MVIESVNPTTVKVSLSESDLERFGLKFENLSRDSFETRLLLSSLISVITARNAMRLDSDRLFVEAFEQDNGCIIYISSLPAKAARINASDLKAAGSVLTIEAKDPRKLQGIIPELFGGYSDIIKSSRLYTSGGAYRLVLEAYKKYDKRFMKFSQEHSVGICTDSISASVTAEHWNCLLPENAVEVLNEKLTSDG